MKLLATANSKDLRDDPECADLFEPDFILYHESDVNGGLNPFREVSRILGLEHDAQPRHQVHPMQVVEGEDRPQFRVEVVIRYGDVRPDVDIVQGNFVLRDKIAVGNERLAR